MIWQHWKNEQTLIVRVSHVIHYSLAYYHWSDLDFLNLENPWLPFHLKRQLKGYIIKADKVLQNLKEKNAFWGPKTCVFPYFSSPLKSYNFGPFYLFVSNLKNFLNKKDIAAFFQTVLPTLSVRLLGCSSWSHCERTNYFHIWPLNSLKKRGLFSVLWQKLFILRAIRFCAGIIIMV